LVQIQIGSQTHMSNR